MKRYEMIKNHDSFNEIINKGKKLKNNYFLIFMTKSTLTKPHFGIAVGKNLGNAVVRNKFKRQLRNIIDHNKFLFKNNYNYIIIIKRECIGISYKELEDNLISLMRKDITYEKENNDNDTK